MSEWKSFFATSYCVAMHLLSRDIFIFGKSRIFSPKDFSAPSFWDAGRLWHLL
jgi:hypothetical protein